MRSLVLVRALLSIVFSIFFTYPLFGQNGLQLNISGNGGLGVIAPQNHFDNSYYELDYKLKFSMGGQAMIGYGINEDFSTHLLVGYQKYNQAYHGSFSPGLGAPPQQHEKNIELNYVQLGVLAKFATSFQDSYVYDSKAQLVISTGFILGKLLSADLVYKANDIEVPYPQKLIPYTDPDYPYLPTASSEDLFTPWNLKFVLNVGADIFLTEKLALSPSIQGQASILDINAKKYRAHENYKASRILYGGFLLGVSYYFNRG